MMAPPPSLMGCRDTISLDDVATMLMRHATLLQQHDQALRKMDTEIIGLGGNGSFEAKPARQHIIWLGDEETAPLPQIIGDKGFQGPVQKAVVEQCEHMGLTDKPVEDKNTWDDNGLKMIAKPLRHSRARKSGKVNMGMPEYELRRTVWDAALLLGLEDLDLTSSCVLMLDLTICVLAQCFVCYILITNPSFFNPSFFRDLEPNMQRWRFSDAHNSEFADPVLGASLASRVCNNDESLSMATAQTALLKDINTYMSLTEHDLEGSAWSVGSALSTLCVFLFVTSLVSEVRQILRFYKAVSSLPREGTRIDGDALVSISSWKLCGMRSIAAMRCVISAVILISGIMWLSFTISIDQLILNTAALKFVLDVDEAVFSAFVPEKVKNLMYRLAPIRQRRQIITSNALALISKILPLAAVLATSGLACGLVILPNTQTMLQVKRKMCEGFLDFGLTTGLGTGIAYAYNTQGWIKMDKNPSFTAIGMQAVIELKDAEWVRSSRMGAEWEPRTTPTNCIWSPSLLVFRDASGTPKTKVSGSLSTCSDWHDMTMSETGRKYFGNFEPAFAAIRASLSLSGTHIDAQVDRSSMTCSDYVSFCSQSELLVQVCPKTCGQSCWSWGGGGGDKDGPGSGKGSGSNATTPACAKWAPHPSCLAEFTYQGKNYTGCTDKDDTKHWCSPTEKYSASSYKYCTCKSSGEPDGSTSTTTTLALPGKT